MINTHGPTIMVFLQTSLIEDSIHECNILPLYSSKEEGSHLPPPLSPHALIPCSFWKRAVSDHFSAIDHDIVLKEKTMDENHDILKWFNLLPLIILHE